jgi:hypothetical protein
MHPHPSAHRSLLQRAEEHVALGEKHVEQQRALVAHYERRGWDAKAARELLTTFEQVQAHHTSTLERRRRELTRWPHRG